MSAPQNTLKAALQAGQPQLGLWLSLVSSYSAELLGDAGFDWLLIDGEHAPNDLQTIVQQLQALRFSDTPVLVRPPMGEPWLIKQLLDAGVQSLLIPMVESGAQAELLVKAVRYPPRGIRGVGAGAARATHFGRVSDYADGVDCVFIGPSDLSADMGYLGDIFAPEVQSVIEDAIERIRGHGKAVGVYMADPAYAKRYLALGASFIAMGSDVSVLTAGSKQLQRQFRP
jgi:4-hydroxy-2-oxoheptanedioate aldolase